MDREYLINDLNRIMKEKSWISPEDLQELSVKFSRPLSAIKEMASFYDHLRLKPSGKHAIKVCVGTACFVKGSDRIYDAFFKALGLVPGEDTDKDRLFTLQKAACLGCCMLAPAVQIGSKIYGPVDEKDVGRILTEHLNLEADRESTGQNAVGEVDVKVCTCSSCAAAGASAILQNARDVVTSFDLDACVHESSCHGRSYQAPVLTIEKKGHIHEFGPVRPEDVHQLIGQYAQGKKFFKNLANKTAVFFSKLSLDATAERRIVRGQEGRRFVMDKAGISLPLENVSSEIWNERRDFFKILFAKEPGEALAILEKSGLRGRGGAGFPSARKWQTVRESEGEVKYVIVNADEGDPGAFMDRLVLESFPYRVLEGVLIAAFVTGAQKAVVYVRSEYPLAVARIRAAACDFLEAGLLGDRILGTGLSLSLDIVEGAGAFVCGEESALIASIENGPGRPKIRPPYPAVKGLYGYPTLVNNVETFACVSAIFRRSDDVFALTGTETSKGTKTFALAGKIKNGGLIEVPMGISLREIIFGIGGGMEEGRNFRAVQLGGPSGGCLGIESLDQKVDFDSLKSVGAMMGSGGLVVLDDHDCMIQIALYFTRFAVSQSCGQCVFCREGSRQIAALLEGISEGRGKSRDLDEIRRIGNLMKSASLCSLGKTAAQPALSTIANFPEEYEEHLNGFCRSGRCRSITKFVIGDDCIGCTKCAQICPVEAIDKRPYYKHEIRQDKCTVCGSCFDNCPRKAIRAETKTAAGGLA